MSTHTDIWISGAFAVVVVDFLVYPFDTLKTRIQSPTYTKIYKNPQTGAVNRSLLFRGLYQGVGSVVLATIPASGAFFTTYEALKHTLHTTLPSQSQSNPLSIPTPKLPDPIIHSISSCTAEAISCFIITPAEVLKQNAQVLTNTNTTPKGKNAKKGALYQTILKFRHQPYKLWSGYTALLGRNLPFTGLNWPVFEYLRGKLFEGIVARRGGGRRGGGRGRDGDGRVEGGRGGDISAIERALITGVSAAMAGTVSSVVTMPVDVVKTRMMLGATATASGEGRGGEGKGSRSAWGMGKRVVREEGVRGLFKGGAIRSLWTAVSFGIYLCMYEGGRGFLQRRREGDTDSEGSG